ncbi:S8 family peptidase [Terrimonas sp. NA20]|uniref:S8 family peptidase n=1 Tax=Terrimonas ginsenosidimutans TaxID=2908004 RepID=A0ABS9KTU6_9BACT|nr:S8 family peptidase [Terrimonas ginsenosidimutans]MCG2615731.1 S8 family peptidase [Terrimonas ginsenosidimutans]
MRCRFFSFLVILLITKISLAQQGRSNDLFEYYRSDVLTSNRLSSFSVIEYRGSLPPEIKIIRSLSSSTAIISTAQTNLIPSSQLIRNEPASDKWKLSSHALLNDKGNNIKLIVSGNELGPLISFVTQIAGSNSIIKIDSISRAVLFKGAAKDLNLILQSPLITFLDIQPKPTTEIGIIGYDQGFHGINELSNLIPYANGKGITVGVKEQTMEAEDLDLYKRVLPSSLASSSVSNHATVISSIIGGAGNSYYDGLGIANDCRFFPTSFSDLFADEISVLKNAKVTVQNHSYGTLIQTFYGVEAISYDAQSFNNIILHVFSAGNQGKATPAEGRYAGIEGYGNLTGNFKSAKNVITVGAVDNQGSLVAESSAGPLYDGRLAPQLIALGPNGTSDAAAMVSGTIAVLQQVYADSNQQNIPSSSLIRSALYSTTDDIYNRGIDHKTGYGLLNSYKAVRLIQQKKYHSAAVASGDSWSATIDVPVNTSQLKMTLCWNDPPAAVNNISALINDLDLELRNSQTGEIYRPWVLSSFPLKDSLEKLASRGRDSLNTSEQISIQLPAAGSYEISVSVRAGNAGAVPFSVAWFVDTLHSFRFTSPQQASDINPENNPSLSIRWATQIADAGETGDLFISYDKGSVWTSIATAVPLSSRIVNWIIPDTTSMARLKMRTAFGEFSSGDFVIIKLLRPQPDFVCTDSFRLSWKRHVYAQSYVIYSLTDSSHLKPVMNTVDTFVTIDRKTFPSLVYAVQPILSNHLPAARSIAMNIELQGVQCFLRALNYILEDENRLRLKLELSTTSGVDSIRFERVSVNGQLLQVLGDLKVNAGQLDYTHLMDDPVSGTIYIRARIQLRNGVYIKTDIIEVLSSGASNILFYPNPVRQSSKLLYVVKQGISPDCRLQVLDLLGRTIRQYASLPISIDMTGVLPGTYILRVSDRTGKIIETTKQIVQ